MNYNPLVSIIIPFYKNKDTLKNSIVSALRQTYKNIEIILINNNGDSESLTIANEYEANYENIHLYNETRQGQTYAVTKAIRNINGEYFCFLDADDTLKNDFIATLLPYIYEYDLVSSSYYKVLENGKIKEIHLPSKEYLVKNTLNEYFYKNNSITTFQNISVFRWGKIYKKDIALKIIDEYKSYGFKMYEDMAFNLLYLEQCKNYIQLDYLGYFYIQYKISSSKVFNYDYKDILSLRYNVKNFLHTVYKRNNISDDNFITCDFDLTKYYLSRVIKTSNYKISKNFFNEIKKDKEYQDSLKNVTTFNSSKAYKIYLFLLKKNMFLLIYLAYKYIL